MNIPDHVSYNSLASAIEQRERGHIGCTCPNCYHARYSMWNELKRKHADLTCPERDRITESQEKESGQKADIARIKKVLGTKQSVSPDSMNKLIEQARKTLRKLGG